MLGILHFSGKFVVHLPCLTAMIELNRNGELGIRVGVDILFLIVFSCNCVGNHAGDLIWIIRQTSDNEILDFSC